MIAMPFKCTENLKAFNSLPSLLSPKLPSWLHVSVLETTLLEVLFLVSPVVVIAFKKVYLCVFCQYDLTWIRGNKKTFLSPLHVHKVYVCKSLSAFEDFQSGMWTFEIRAWQCDWVGTDIKSSAHVFDMAEREPYPMNMAP